MVVLHSNRPQRDPEIVRRISATTKDSLLYAFDAIATDETASICVSSFTSKKSREVEKAFYACTLDPKLPAVTPLPVEKRAFLGYTSIGEYFIFEGEDYPAVQEDFEFTRRFAILTEKLLDSGRLKNHPILVDQQGADLEGVIEGLKILKGGKVSGAKLIYNIRQS